MTSPRNGRQRKRASTTRRSRGSERPDLSAAEIVAAEEAFDQVAREWARRTAADDDAAPSDHER